VTGSEKMYRKFNNNKKRNRKLLTNLLDLSRLGLWYKKVEKCNIKMKKIKPTPKSITHRNPTKISASSINK
jgi:hypothetical protein